jgi:hypothetical protein
MSPQERHMVKMIQKRIDRNLVRLAFVVKKLLEPMSGIERKKYIKLLKDLKENQRRFYALEAKFSGGIRYEL